MENNKIQFFVGILPTDRDKLISDINKFGWIKENEYDDPDGYYMFVMRGSWDDYNVMNKLDYKKSIEHFEE